jgi:hypothetical protein
MIRKLTFCVVVLCVLGTGALAETFGRGYVPPPDWDRTFQEHLRIFPADKDPLPAVWDWRTMNGVTVTQNQGSCGSCWAFAAAGEMEAKIRIYYGNRILDLSEQQIVSCNPYGSGCGGGWAGAAYYVFQQRGGVTEDTMPYEGSDAVPCTDTNALKFTDLDSWYTVANNVDQIKQALLEGPVCTAIDANDAFSGYSSGCLDAPGGYTNHLVLIVGWDDRACEGDTGAWIIKNSWGPGWGQAGFGYIKYGACSIGQGVTALRYTPPPVDIRVTGPVVSQPLYGQGPVDITWNTFGQATSTVDIWFGTAGYFNNVLVADNAPNTGSFAWTLPNITTDRASFVVFPGAGTALGYGFTLEMLTVLGQQTRYVSSTGSNTPPYDTPARAARTISAAVLAGAGRDTVKVAAGEYLETIAVNSPCVIVGGYNNAFSINNPVAYPTRLRGVTGALRFSAGAGNHCGVRNIVFHDCVAAIGSVPVPGYNGAAILSTGASPTIENCVFEDNLASPMPGVGWGGALLLHQGSPVIRNCTFTGNIGSHGGAVALSQPAGALIENCTFNANACSDSTGDYRGGAVYLAGGDASLRNCVLTGNGAAATGGAIAVAAGGQLTLDDCNLTGNRASSGGGGVHVQSGALVATGGDWQHNVSVTGNGGAVWSESGVLSLHNVSVSGNTAANLGGGVMGMGVTTGGIEHCVFYGNTAAQGGGFFAVANGTFAARHNIVQGNSGGGMLASGAAVVSDYNVCWQNIPTDYLSPPGAHDRVVNPCLTAPQTRDFALGLHSAALDAGDPDGSCQDPDGSPADIGAYGGPDASPVAPPAITGGHLTSLGGGALRVQWNASPAADVVSYIVYRDTAAQFVPSADKMVAIVTHPTTSYEDTPPDGSYYLVVARDTAGHVGGYSARLSSADSTPVPGSGLPTALAIGSIAPNPFNPRTTVQFDVPRDARVSLRVYDLRGRLIAEPYAGNLTAGRHTVEWDGQDRGGRAAPTGIYLMRLDDGQRQVTAKAVLAK